MARRRWILSLWGAVALLMGGGCQALEPPPLPTLIPTQMLPTVIALTVAADDGSLPAPTHTPVQPATASPLPPAVTPPPTHTPVPATPIPWPTPTVTAPALPDLNYVPYAPIQILTPGEDSKVRSPIEVRFAVQPRRVQRLQVELVGEDERLLYRKVLRVPEGAAGTLFNYKLTLPFEIRAEVEMARLQWLAFDEANREMFRTSIHLVLLRSGWEEMRSGDVILSPIIIEDPPPGHLVQGGQVVVSGLAWPTNGMLEVALVSAEGKVLGYSTGPVSLPGPQGYGRFAVAVPYQVEGPTWVRLVAREYDTVPPGIRYLNSLEVLIAP